MSYLLYGFTISADAIDFLGRLSPLEARRYIKELLNLWRRNGVFVTNSNANHVGLLAKRCDNEGFPDATRRQLKDLLAAPFPRVAARVFPPDGSIPSDVVTPPEGSWFVGLEEGERWKLNDDAPTRLAETGVEVCRVDWAVSTRWQEVTMEKVIAKKKPVSEIVELFQVVGAFAKTIDIVDIFCGKEEVVKPGKSGVLHYLRDLARDSDFFESKIRIARIYASKNVPKSNNDSTRVSGAEIAEAWRAAVSNLGETSLRMVELHLIDANRFSAIAHDRFANFENGAVAQGSNRDVSRAFQIGAGFSVFEGKKVSRQTTVSSVKSDQVRGLIDELEAEASHEVVEIMIPGRGAESK